MTTVKFLHTADWHIGKIVNEQSMLEDQAYILDELIKVAEQHQVDAVLMAGDLYDRSLPPKEAVSLVNTVLSRFINELAIPVFTIAGNHDGNERVEFLWKIAEASQLYMEGTLKHKTRKVSLADADIYMIPYADHILVRNQLDRPEIKTIEDAVKVQIDQIIESDEYDRTRVNILMLHGYVISGSREYLSESDSERPLSVGTAECVDVSLLSEFDYVALGHLHKAQRVGRDSVRYSGSPLKYSKSEVNHEKKCYIVDVTTTSCQVEAIKLVPKRDMRVITGTFEELMTATSDDYIYIELTDQFFINDAMNRLRYRYPNALSLEYINLLSTSHNSIQRKSKEVKALSVEELFSDFFEQYTDHKLDEARRDVVREVIEAVEQQEDK